jgi:hypothetical protein
MAARFMTVIHALFDAMQIWNDRVSFERLIRAGERYAASRPHERRAMAQLMSFRKRNVLVVCPLSPYDASPGE